MHTHPTEGEGDVLAVHEDVQQRLAGRGHHRRTPGADDGAQVGDDVRHRQPRFAQRRVVDHAVEVPTGQGDFAQHGPQRISRPDGQLRGDIPYPPVPAWALRRRNAVKRNAVNT
ncbi:hypothetical protein ACQEWB_33900 [Streptomyces sp. CA-249302]|uniref:hypothetical protein n=1 Tax=Streptomyces sp. CA-249302 TaxID=3240058 RepID=UPI003D94B21B